ncbi:MAG: hypothetical protein KDJ25_17840 [Rhodoblastus sp.]|nr:hypothetical protein [Rhodoblastus sp.]
MKFRTASLVLAASAFVLTGTLAASAQSSLKPIPKPSDRRPGELEGWSDTPKPEAKKDRREARKPVAAKTAKAAKAEKPAEKPQGGGIPLPNSRTDPNDYAPVGFDKDGKLGTGLKF